MDKLQILKHPQTGKPIAAVLNDTQLFSLRAYQINNENGSVSSTVILELSNVDVNIQAAKIRNEGEPLDNEPEPC